MRGVGNFRTPAFPWTQGGTLLHASSHRMASPPKQPELSGGTLIDVEKDGNGRPEDAPGSTAVVRTSPKPGALPPARRPEPPPGAPKKGLQISLPDDEPAPAPPPKRPLAPPAEEKQGRRGAWWDAKHEKEPEAGPDDLPGATAVLQAAEPAPPPPPAPRPPPEPDEPEVEPYRPQPAEDYQGDVPEGPPRWKVLLRRAGWVASALVILGIVAVIGGYIYISREIPTFDSVRDYHPFV